jgi:membrane protein
LTLQRFLPRPLVRAATVGGAVSARMTEVHLGLIAAGVAFYGLLAIFPALTALVAVWGLFSDPAQVAEQAQAFEEIVPDAASGILERQLDQLASGPAQTLGWATGASLLAALWASRSGVGALMGALNAVGGFAPRGGILNALTALGLTLVLIGVALVALAAVVVAPVVLAFVPLGPFAGAALDLLRWALGIGVVLAGIGLLYRFAPNGRAAPNVRRLWGVFTPGAVVAVALWAAASWAFSAYLANFGSYDRVYGSLGAVIALLMWFWLSAFVVLLGAVLDSVLSGTRSPGAPGGETDGETGEEAGADGDTDGQDDPAGRAASPADAASDTAPEDGSDASSGADPGTRQAASPG